MSPHAVLGLTTALLTLPIPATAQQSAPAYRDAGRAMAARVIEAEPILITQMQLGRMARDTNLFTARITNTDSLPHRIGLSLRAVPGLWIRGNWQRGYAFDVPGGGTRRIEVPYVFERMTPEATLRVSFGTPASAGGGIAVRDPFFDTTLVVGDGNPDAVDPRLAFDSLRTPHLTLFAWRGSRAATELARLAAARESAVERVAALLDVRVTRPIRVIFYPDSASKTSQTGHIGAGFASGGTIVEIYNDSIQLDPYHEITHIVAATVGAPPAVLDEGFAVYASELLGADALQYLGSPGRSVAEAVCDAQRAGRLMPFRRLFRFTDIGPTESEPAVSYPESASVVAFLISRYGIGPFRELYRTMGDPTSDSGSRRNEAALARLNGSGLSALEEAWRTQLQCH